MKDTEPVVFGLAGLGGYAAVIGRLLEQCSWPDAQGNPPVVRLAAVCDPDLGRFASKVAELRGKGVAVFDSFEKMLTAPIEAVWLPVPIDLHRPFTEQALAAGKAVMVEKPAAGSIDDLDAMIAARDRTRLPVAVGFQDIYDSQTLPIKRMLAAGTIGRIRSATLYACWPRGDDYYARASWAGRIQRNGTWVLDSPLSNALAHFVNLLLFWLGPSDYHSAVPLALEAELYRVRPIENFDTCSIRIHLSDNRQVLVLLTHACGSTVHPRIVIHGTHGVFRWAGEHGGIVELPGGKIGPTFTHDGKARQNMVRRFAAAVRGQNCPDTPLATLEIARSHLLVVNGASEAAPIYDVPPAATTPSSCTSGPLQAILHIEAAFERCASQQKMLHESGFFRWTHPASSIDLRNYNHFRGPAQAPSQQSLSVRH